MYDQATSLRKKVKAKRSLKLSKTRIIAFASGKGGTGKSNITINLGLALRKMGKRVLLLDADLGTANIDVLLGLTPRYNLSHFLEDKCSFEDVLLNGPRGIDILPGTSGTEDLINISFQEVKRLIEASSQMEANYDIILIDIGAGIHCGVINFIRACERVVIVLTPEPTAIMDAYSLIKILANHNYRHKIDLLINQVDSYQEGERVACRMKNVIKEYLKLDVEILGYIPYDPYLPRSVKEQVAILIRYPESKAGQALQGIANKIANQIKEIQSRGIKGFVYRLIGFFNYD